MNKSDTAEVRAAKLVGFMNVTEMVTLMHGKHSEDKDYGWYVGRIDGIERLGIRALQMNDGSVPHTAPPPPLTLFRFPLCRETLMVVHRNSLLSGFGAAPSISVLSVRQQAASFSADVWLHIPTTDRVQIGRKASET